MLDCQLKVKKILLIIIASAVILTLPSMLIAKNADELYREGRFADAQKAYQQKDMDNPRDIRYRYNRGCAAFQNSDYKGAAAAFSSVLRRAKNKDMQFKAAYNLGNTAFVQNDFATAIELYKQSIVLNPENSEAKYNLELSLKKFEETNQKKDNKDENKKNDKNGQDKKDGDQKQSDRGQNQNKKQESENKKNENGKNENGKKEPQDLSGDLSAANEMGEKSKKEQQAAAAALLNRKKAEALLDNIKEDRSKILEFQTTKEKKGDAGSGKNW